jgi:catechol 2,3-dioxygenase-like lactoylglutathione lyase family enzyme
MPILSLDHVQIAIPVASEDRARAFYSGMLGLRSEPACPQAGDARDLLFLRLPS